MQLRSHANAPTTVHKVQWTLVMHGPERSEDCEATEVHNVRWTLALDGPKRSEDVGKRSLHGTENITRKEDYYETETFSRTKI